jgi:hypothetical protein
MNCRWSTLLSAAGIEADFALAASLDPAFAGASRTFWATRSAGELRVLRDGAWLANDPDTYQMARSLLALKDTLNAEV